MKSKFLLLFICLTQSLTAQTFTEVTPAPEFDGVFHSSIAFSDIDGDNDQDVLITGMNNSGEPIAKLYTNDGIASSTGDFIAESPLELTLFPNPSSLPRLYVHYHATNDADVMVTVYSITGSLLSQQREFASEGRQTFTIDMTSLPRGNYFIQVEHDKRKAFARFVVQ
jgi:hypothetical protein